MSHIDLGIERELVSSEETAFVAAIVTLAEAIPDMPNWTYEKAYDRALDYGRAAREYYQLQLDTFEGANGFETWNELLRRQRDGLRETAALIAALYAEAEVLQRLDERTPVDAPAYLYAALALHKLAAQLSAISTE